MSVPIPESLPGLSRDKAAAFEWDPVSRIITTRGALEGAIEGAWPVGSIFISVDATNPAETLGFGTWVAFGAGRVLVGLDAGQAEFNTVEETGGEKTHVLAAAEMPSHTHTFAGSVLPGHAHGLTTLGAKTVASGAGASVVDGSSGLAQDTDFASAGTPAGTNSATGGGGAHNNLQPYIVVHFWKRTA